MTAKHEFETTDGRFLRLTLTRAGRLVWAYALRLTVYALGNDGWPVGPDGYPIPGEPHDVEPYTVPVA